MLYKIIWASLHMQKCYFFSSKKNGGLICGFVVYCGEGCHTCLFELESGRNLCMKQGNIFTLKSNVDIKFYSVHMTVHRILNVVHVLK